MILSHIKWQFFQDLKFQNGISDWVPFCITFKAMIFCKTICLTLLDMYTSTHIHILEPVVLGYIDRPREYMERSLKFYMCVSVVWACFIALVHVRRSEDNSQESGSVLYFHHVAQVIKLTGTMFLVHRRLLKLCSSTSFNTGPVQTAAYMYNGYRIKAQGPSSEHLLLQKSVYELRQYFRDSLVRSSDYTGQCHAHLYPTLRKLIVNLGHMEILCQKII